MLKIKVLNSQAPGEVQPHELMPEKMPKNECIIGRSPDSGLVLATPEVSRYHGKFVSQQGKYYFSDTGSSGGSQINKAAVEVNHGYVLQAGDVIHIGKFIIEVLSVVELNGDPTVVPGPTPKSADPSQYMPVALVDPQQITRWTKGSLAVRCVRAIDETQDVKTFRFVADPPMLFTYKPGQFVTLDLEINGEQVLRSYSISSTPSRPHTLEITVKRVERPTDAPTAPAGLVSNWLHDNIKTGSQINLSGPMGKFTCFANPSQKLLTISAGSGITPMMSMSRWVYDTASDCDIVFLHSARSPRDIIFRQELELMASRNPNFRLAITTTRSDPGQTWMGFTGRITDSMLQMVAPDFRERTVYVCGPESFMRGIKDLLAGMQFPMQNYYEESFGVPKKAKTPPQTEAPATPAAANISTPATPAKGFGLGAILGGLQSSPASSSPILGDRPAAIARVASPPTSAPASSSSNKAVVFTKSGKEVPCDGEESILNLAEQQGVKIRSSCRSGVCGTCKKRKLEGEVKMENYDSEALEDSERAEGFILTCIAYPLGRVAIEA